MKSALFSGASAMSLAVIASAGGTITSGDASFAVGVGSFSGVFDSNLGDATLRTDGASPDLAYKYCWYYRTQGNATNRVFSSLDTPAQTYIADTATATYTNAGPGVSGTTFSDRFNAVITTRLVDGDAPGQLPPASSPATPTTSRPAPGRSSPSSTSISPAARPTPAPTTR